MSSEKIFVTRPSMPSYEEYTEAVRPLWDSHWLTNMGKYHQKLEQRLKEYLGVPNLSLMVNGHTALELTIQAFGFPEGAEVITTPFTFVSTTHAIVRNRLVPVFCDIKPEDGTIDETKIEGLITGRTVAVVPVHVYGNVCSTEEIQKIADEYGLKVIYDAAHAFGVKYKGKGVGGYGDASIFSFHATKVFNTIEGGAVSFSDEQLYERLYNLKNFGIRNEELVEEVGTNAKLNEFCAIMGLCNLKNIDRVLEERKNYYECYMESLRDVEGIDFLSGKPDVESNYGYFPILVDESIYGEDRDALFDYLNRENIIARKYFYPLTLDQVCYKEKYQFVEVENARRLADRVIALPLYENLGVENIKRICRVILQHGKEKTGRSHLPNKC